jgi:triosephosphate isomerase
MRKLLIAANWKMNLNTHQSSNLLVNLDKNIKLHRNIEIVLAPSMLSIQPLSLMLDRRKFRLAAQDGFYVDQGAYTGEVSLAMMRELIHYVIIGHSERRIYFHESLDTIRDKVAAAARNDISPILCIGETKREHEAGETKQVLHDQLVTAVSDLTSGDFEKVVVVYEPVWAISTFDGELADPDQVQGIIKYIRDQIGSLYGNKAAEVCRVLYGGSVDDQTAAAYLKIDGCDGCLVGGASLNYQKFSNIIKLAEAVQYERLKG